MGLPIYTSIQHRVERCIMANSFAEIILGYGFAIVLFAGLPAVVFLMLFLPGLMRTTGEAIGASQENASTAKTFSRRLSLQRSLPRHRTKVTMA